MENIVPYLLLAAFALFLAWRWLGFQRARRALPGYLERGAAIVDVRSPAEFASGHAPGSINIPLGELSAGASRLDRGKPVVVCCASGTRSGMAVAILKKAGFREVVNAGPWRNIP